MESGIPLAVGGVYLMLRHSTKIENIFCETKCDWLNLKDSQLQWVWPCVVEETQYNVQDNSRRGKAIITK